LAASIWAYASSAMAGWTLDTLKEHFDALRRDDKDAVSAAFEAAKEKSQSHNDLIREGQRKEQTYVTKAELYAGLIAVTALIGAAMAILKFFVPTN